MNFRIIKLFVLTLTISGTLYGQQGQSKSLTANQIIDMIKSKVTCPWSDTTVDTFKAGNPAEAVTGIAVCMFADMKVLKQAADSKCNLIITHEPIFYNHLDETKNLQNDPVFQAKMKFISEHKLIIWRFHDHIHKTDPDGIYVGMVEKLGWENNKADNSLIRFKFEPTKLSKFVSQLKAKFPGNAFRVVGNPDMMVTNVALALGAPGSTTHIKLLEGKATDLLITGEAPEWETYQYVHDAQYQGLNKSVIFLGHNNSEEGGMNYCARWLKKFIPQSIPVQYIQSESSYITY